jgi:hypothetical protein
VSRGANQLCGVIRWLMKHAVLLGLLSLVSAGCGQVRSNGATDATMTSSTPTAGLGRYITEVRAMSFGTRDLAAASDEDLLQLGMVVCDGLGIEGLGFRRVVQRLVQSEAHPTTTEATALVRSAMRNLCAQHTSTTN